ncbi:sugar phosphate isomerase/epimerase [Paenibacillus sp. WQ 127069]|uniref:Sugar phosphate isomerase/epimerase n=1 Tax=Paenibacillus baimaensis TaxID=2982185 RepID=A0ABT2UD64_9BACL|nr:sugar phosphate isomerase/epimerase [Paenibacillus sp. WQ 127069]MCU6792574.1 sugar phosphate isomerase/epimerase [Paenibacillus sp. WQ 127069]
MKDNIKDYARIGLVHHMIYPECMTDADAHVNTLLGLNEREDIETFDCCIPFGEERRRQLIRQVARTRKEIVYALHLYPLRKIALASPAPHEQEISRLIVRDQIEMAAAIGATGFVFASGLDFPDDREGAKIRFAEFTRWFCEHLARYSITALLEPFDREIDKKFLLGPSEECAEFVQSLRQSGAHNLSIELDMAHVPLMGESFAHAIRTVSPYLKRVHLGNCILKDTKHIWYGDYHPPMGYKGGEIDTPELAGILQELLSVGYLNKEERGALVLEMVPFPGETSEYTIQDNLGRLEEAWRLV